MRRADRLFQIIQLLRRRRTVVTAAALAGRLDVSERTIYRDIRDLILSGTPIDGEAGVGYRLRPGYDLPPLMFDRDEIEALVLGARIVRSMGDARLARSADSILAKVSAVVPEPLRKALDETKLFAPESRLNVSQALTAVRDALVAHRKLRIAYQDASGQASERTVRPLGAFFWGKVWTLSAWCELRSDFRDFRLDRIEQFTMLADTFEDEPGRTLADLLARYGAYASKLLDR
jgi:predicted DNA-binding transcriptional regulator YafY